MLKEAHEFTLQKVFKDSSVGNEEGVWSSILRNPFHGIGGDELNSLIVGVGLLIFFDLLFSKINTDEFFYLWKSLAEMVEELSSSAANFDNLAELEFGPSC